MKDSSQTSSKEAINLVARNRPVAIVVGVAGFIGSHLSEQLLKLKVQVVGVDNFSSGKRKYLDESSNDKSFYFLEGEIENANVLDVLTHLPRVDYAFFVAKNEESETLYHGGLKNFLELTKRFHDDQVEDKTPHSRKLKLLFLSSIDLYDNRRSAAVKGLGNAEILFAKFSSQNKLNSRIVKLGEVFGPRMQLNQKGVVTRLIRAAVAKNLESENPTHEFSSRGIYIDDAINLITKSILLGSTSNKIFDGILPTPIKVEEIKQVLLDPGWHEKNNFKFSQLPPWETPNLKKSIKTLNWKPKTNLIEDLRKTLEFFAANPYSIGDEQEFKEEEKSESPIDVPKKNESVKKPEAHQQAEIEDENQPQKIKGWSFNESGGDAENNVENPTRSYWPFLRFLVIWIIILAGLVYPILVIASAFYLIPSSLEKAEREVRVGDYQKAEQDVDWGYLSAKEQENVVSVLGMFKFISFLEPTISSLQDSTGENVQALQSGQQTIKLLEVFTNNLEQGQVSSDQLNQFQDVALENQRDLANAVAKTATLGSRKLSIGMVDYKSLQNFADLLAGSNLVKQILPDLLASDGTKKYLVVLEDNQNLNPTGGNIVGINLVRVEKGKVSEISPISFDEINSKLPSNLAPDDLIKTNLKINSLGIGNSNYDSDFPTYAKTLENLFKQSDGREVDGVIVIDNTAAKALMEELDGSGSVFGTSLDPQINNEFLKKLLTQLPTISKKNIFAVGEILNENLDKKHILIFVNDPKLEKTFGNQKWTGAINFANEDDFFKDLLAVNFYQISGTFGLKKQFDDHLTISSQGEVQHTLTVQLSNQGDRVFDGVMVVTLPVGIKLNQILDDSSDKTSSINSVVKYGLSEIFLPITLSPNTSKSFNISYQLPINFNPEKGSGEYLLWNLKQAGTQGDPLSVTFNFPQDWKVSNNLNVQNQIVNGQSIQTNLIQDRAFDLTFSK